MHKKYFKKSAALLLAGVMTFSSVNVYAAQPPQNELSVQSAVAENPGFKLHVQLKSENQIDKPGTDYLGLENIGSVNLSSDDYELKVTGTFGTEKINFTIDTSRDGEGFSLAPGGYEYMSLSYTIPADYTEKVMKYKLQIFDKDSNELVCESEETTVYPFKIQDKVLIYNDSTKDNKYRLDFDLDEEIESGGLIGGGGGDATEIWPSPDINDAEFYLRPGYPSSCIFEIPEGYDIIPELIPADAGTITRQAGAHTVVHVDLHAPAVLKLTKTTECTIDGGNGFKISAPVTEDTLDVLCGFTLNVEDYANETALANLKEIFDRHAQVKGYTFNLNAQYEDMKLESEVSVTLPIPEGWDPSRVEAYYIGDDEGNILSGTNCKVSEDGKSISILTNAFTEELSNTYVLMEHSIPTEVKDWDKVVENYITDARFVNWNTGTTWDDRFYETTASPDDVAIMTLYRLYDKMDWDSEYYNEEKNQCEFPYDVFIKEAADTFKNVPDLKSVNNDLIYYDKTSDKMIVPMTGGIGDAPLVTEVVDVESLGNSIYAIHFLKSHETIAENPDMTDPDQYTKCTLIVEDNQKGNWRYVAFLKDQFIIIEEGTWMQNSIGWWYQYPDGSYPANKWELIDGKLYWFNASGYMTTGWQKIDGKWYYMNTSGAMTTGWQKIDGKWYYMNTSGIMTTGWQQIDNTWYYLKADGTMATGWVQVGRTWYYLKADGAMTTGWQFIGGKWYFMNADGSMTTGWQQISGKWYYMNTSGVMISNQWIGNYYVGASGAMLTNQWIGNYYVGADGLWIPGYKK